MADKIRITEDLDVLFPGEMVSIGKQQIEIKPLGISKLASISKKLQAFGRELAEDGVTWDNYNEHGNILKIATLLLDRFPDVLEDATNIHVDDLSRLPIDIVVELLNKVIEVNLASREKLEKNFESLTSKMQIPKATKKK